MLSLHHEECICITDITYYTSDFGEIFAEFGCEIVVINENRAKSDEEEIFEDIISMLHCFSMRMYSKRRKRKLELMGEDLRNETDI